MSEQAPERGRGGNVFTRKIGPLPMWQWFLIALAMIGVYVIYQYRKNNQAAANTANTAAGTPTGGTTGAGQVPQFVNQTNTYVAPPSAQQPPPSRHVHQGGGGGGAGPGGKTGFGAVKLGGAPGLPNAGIWSTSVEVGATPAAAAGGTGLTIPFGTYQLSGAPVSQGGATYYPIIGPGGQKLYALGENVSSYQPTGRS